jgi:hypothetical protein
VAGDSQDPAIDTDAATRAPWPPVVQSNLATSSSDCTGGHEPNLGLGPFSELHHASRTTTNCLNVVRVVYPRSDSLAVIPRISRRGSLAGKDRIGYPVSPGNSFSSTFAIACG